MKHYVYLIYNTINNNIYIGKRSCKGDIHKDDYWGSGISIKQDIFKNGKQFYKKKVLEICKDEYEAFEKEAKYIEYYRYNPNFNVLNVHSGGAGGFVRKAQKHTKETKWYDKYVK